MKITSRDIKVFILGFIAFFIVESIYNWESSVSSFKRGFNNGSNAASNVNSDKAE